jgi:hypothetical protein
MGYLPPRSFVRYSKPREITSQTFRFSPKILKFEPITSGLKLWVQSRLALGAAFSAQGDADRLLEA